MELALLIFTCAAWAVTGYQICTSRHRQRGMEVDHFWDVPADLMPSGSPLLAPDDPRLDRVDA